MPNCKEMQTKLQEIYNTDEPFFIFRSTDILTPSVITMYKNLYESHVIKCSNDFEISREAEGFCEKLDDMAMKIIEWQRLHKDKVKIPD